MQEKNRQLKAEIRELQSEIERYLQIILRSHRLC